MSRVPTPSLRGFGALLMAVGLVTALAGGGVLGPGAQSTFEDTTDAVNPVGEARACGGLCVGGAVVGGIIVGGAVNEWMSGDSNSETYTQVSKQQTMEDVEAHALTIKDDQEPFHATMENQLGDGSTTVAWSKMKAEVVKELNNGTTEANATETATETVENYYASMQRNYLGQWNRISNRLQYLQGVWTGHSELSNSPWRLPGGGNEIEGYLTGNYTLANGNTTEIKAPYRVGDTGNFVAVSPVKNASRVEWDTDMTLGFHENGPVSMKGTEYTNQTEVVKTGRYQQTLTQSWDLNSQMLSNADLYVSNTYSEYEAGEINESDFVDPMTLAQEFSTKYNSTGHYAYAGAELAVMGVETDLTKTFTIETESDTTLSGSLYTDWKPERTNGSFETGVEYDPLAANASVMFATSDGIQLVRESFTITEMYNARTGESVENTTTQDYNRQTANASITQEQLTQLIELQQELAEQEAAAATGGSDGGGFDFGFGNIGQIGGGAAIVLAGAALVLLKD